MWNQKKSLRTMKDRNSKKMPKLKTHSGAKKRFHVTGNGKLMRMKGHSSHLRRKKSGSSKRSYDKKLPVSAADHKRLAKVLLHTR